MDASGVWTAMESTERYRPFVQRARVRKTSDKTTVILEPIVNNETSPSFERYGPREG